MSLNKEVGLDDVMQIIAEKLETGGSVTFEGNKYAPNAPRR